MSDGWLYEVGTSEPIRFRAHGLDAAMRVRRRVEEAMRAAVAADPEVIEPDKIEVRDLGWLREAPAPCDHTRDCRAALHNRECASRKP